MRFLTRVLALASLIFSVLGVTFFHAFASTGHACAPSTPPSVAGQPILPAPTTGTVLINEVLLVPHSTWNCSDTSSTSISNDIWIELYNPQDQPLDLSAANANLDSGPGTNIFFFLANSAIAPHGFLTIFPDASPTFTLTVTHELRLKFADAVIDDIFTPSLGQDQSYARVPDGSTNWQITDTPTINATNSPAAQAPADATATVRAGHVDATATVRVEYADATATVRADRIDTTATAQVDRADATATARAVKANGGTTAPPPGTTNDTGSTGVGNGSNDGTNSALADQGTPVDGIQPTWSTFQFPSEAATTPVEADLPAADALAAPAAPPTSNPTDTPSKALFTMAAVVVFTLLLVGCRRLVRKRLNQ